MTSHKSRIFCAAITVAIASTAAVLPQFDGPSGLRLCGAEQAPAPQPPALPPLTIDRAAPLLLDDSPTEKMEDTSFLNINQACFVCHDNYRTESLVVMHAKDSVGCIDCHGPSLAHRNDEDNITPPDIMYPADKIEDACLDCHDTHDAPARDVIARWQERSLQQTDLAALLCTDCHGEHRLKSRIVRWDKGTGKLLMKEVTGEQTSAEVEGAAQEAK